MRVCIVTPSEEFNTSAGVRIRYDRLAAAAQMTGHDIVLQPINEFQSRGDFVHDAYVFAKTYTPIAPLLAWRMRQAGKLVGLDIFDDYFTQVTDSRLLRYRLWFAEMSDVAQFYLCSTPRLAQAISPLTRGAPLKVTGDPSDTLDPQLLDHLITTKAIRRAADGVTRVLWFGIGDNPFFPVGLRDLAAFGHQLAELSPAGGPRAALRILTNTRAMTAEGLASLRRLPLPYTIEEWTADRERQELRDADVCFLPVNAQSFSRVKSLNRAITALTEGCQVLSAGFPLYAELGGFIYRSAEKLRGDLASGREALRADTLTNLISMLNRTANPYLGATDLIGHLSRVEADAAQAPSTQTISPFQPNAWPLPAKYEPDLAVVHGALPEGRLHKLVQRFNGLAVHGPLCREGWNCHLRFELTESGALRVLVEKATTELLEEGYRATLVPFGKVRDFDFDELCLDDTPLAPRVKGWPPPARTSLVRMHALASRIESDVMTICRTVMPSVRFLANEKLAAVAPAARLAS